MEGPERNDVSYWLRLNWMKKNNIFIMGFGVRLVDKDKWYGLLEREIVFYG